jgi:hypothetical protein
MTRRKPAKQKRARNVQTKKDAIVFKGIDVIASFMNLPSFLDASEEWHEVISEQSWGVLQELEEGDLEEYGEDSEEAEMAFRLEIEQEIEGRLYEWYKDAILGTFEEVLGDVDLVFVQIKQEYHVIPERTWKEAAEEIRQIVMGYGYAHPGYDVEEFLEQSSAENYMGLVGTHLPWLLVRYEVYGGPSPKRIFYGQMSDFRI